MTIQQTNEEIKRLNGRLGTLKGLPDVETLAAPLPDAVVSYYNTNLAGGSGPDGTYLISDFFGTAAGVPYNESLIAVTDIINSRSAVFATLISIYNYMYNVATGVYGAPPSIVIPSGPAAGSYTTYDDALIALVNAANTEIGNVITVLGTSVVAELNTAWDAMAKPLANESTNRAKAGINYSTLPSNYALAISAFIPSIGGLGTQTEQGGSAQLFEGIANTSNQYGQAFIGAMREGRNNLGLGQINLSTDTGIPSQLPAVPPQAVLSDGSYTVAEARAAVTGTA